MDNCYIIDINTTIDNCTKLEESIVQNIYDGKNNLPCNLLADAVLWKSFGDYLKNNDIKQFKNWLYIVAKLYLLSNSNFNQHTFFYLSVIKR